MFLYGPIISTHHSAVIVQANQDLNMEYKNRLELILLRGSLLTLLKTLVTRTEYTVEFTFTFYGVWDEELCLGAGKRALYACGRLIPFSIKHPMNQGQGH